MYTCNECQSTEFEKSGGFLFCAICQVQLPDYIEQSIDYDRMAIRKNLSQATNEITQRSIPLKNWTSWEAYNYILFGILGELKATGLAPVKITSTTISIWSCFLVVSGVDYNSCKRYISTSEKYWKGELKAYGVRRKKWKTGGSSSGGKALHESLSQSTVYKTMSTQASDPLANETIETIGRTFDVRDYAVEFATTSQAAEYSSSPRASHLTGTLSSHVNKKRKLSIPMSKARVLEMLHIALLISGSDLHLSDLIRFIREAHLSFAKITHFFPLEIKLTKGDASFLETVKDDNMPKHGQQRKFGAEIAKKLNIDDFPLPNMESLITRYCNDLNLPDEFTDRALVISQIAAVKNLCTFQKWRKQIPNYEGVAAACLIYAMKVLFGLDDQTEFLLSDMAEKTNKLLNPEEDGILFSFKDWQNFIELRKTVISEMHYPTEEKLKRNEFVSSSGLIDVVVKESKDKNKDERFMSYSQYFMEPGLMKACQDVLTALSTPKAEFTMDFPPSLTPLTSYLDSILNNYEERIKNRTPPDALLPQLEARALELLRTSYRDHKVSFVFNLAKYEELLSRNGFTVKKISRCEQCKTEEDPDEETDEDKVGWSVAYKTSGRDTEKEKGYPHDSTHKSAEAPFGEVQHILPKLVKRRSSPWSKINYSNLASSKDVHFVEDMALTWELLSPRLDDNMVISFVAEVFDKTPINFQWLVKELSLLLEMKERDIYLELFRLEEAIKKRVTLPATTLNADPR